MTVRSTEGPYRLSQLFPEPLAAWILKEALFNKCEKPFPVHPRRILDFHVPIEESGIRKCVLVYVGENASSGGCSGNEILLASALHHVTKKIAFLPLHYRPWLIEYPAARICIDIIGNRYGLTNPLNDSQFFFAIFRPFLNKRDVRFCTAFQTNFVVGVAKSGTDPFSGYYFYGEIRV